MKIWFFFPAKKKVTFPSAQFCLLKQTFFFCSCYQKLLFSVSSSSSSSSCTAVWCPAPVHPMSWSRQEVEQSRDAPSHVWWAEGIYVPISLWKLDTESHWGSQHTVCRVCGWVCMTAAGQDRLEARIEGVAKGSSLLLQTIAGFSDQEAILTWRSSIGRPPGEKYMH